MAVADKKKQVLKIKTRFRMVLSVLLISLLLTATACSFNHVPASTSSPELSQQGESQQTYPNGTQRYESAIVDIQTNGDGYYSLMSDIELQFGENGVECVYVEEPTLLAFSVSSEHQGGVWVLDLNEGNTVLASLEEIRTALSQSGNTDLAEKIDAVIQQFETAGPFTSAST